MVGRAHADEHGVKENVTYKWLAGVLIGALATACYAAMEVTSNRTRIEACEHQMNRIADQIDDIHRLLIERLPQNSGQVERTD